MAAGFVKTFSRRVDFLGQFVGIHFLHCFFSKSNIISLKVLTFYMKWSFTDNYSLSMKQMQNNGLPFLQSRLSNSLHGDQPRCQRPNHLPSRHISCSIYLEFDNNGSYTWTVNEVKFQDVPSFLLSRNGITWLPNFTILRNIIDGDGRATGTSLDVT